MLRTAPALLIGLLTATWSALALADVTVQLSPAVTQALDDAPGEPPATADDITEATNHALKQLAEGSSDARARDAAKRLLDSGQTIRILCREEAREEAKQDEELAAALDQSGPDMLGGGGATLGDFDEQGNPRPGGTTRIVIECGSLRQHGLFGERDILGPILVMLGHELVHASHRSQRHGDADEDAEERAWYDNFGRLFAAPFTERFESYREDKAREERRRRREQRRRGSSDKRTGMIDPPDSGAYVMVTPGLIHIAVPGGQVGYQWGVQGGYLLRTDGLFAIGLGGSFEHAPAFDSAGEVSYAGHQLRVQAEAMPGVALLDGRLFVHADVALGYVGWPQRTVYMDMRTSTSDHGVAASVGVGAGYAVWRSLVVGLDVGGDLQWFVAGGQSYAGHTVDVEASLGWWF